MKESFTYIRERAERAGRHHPFLQWLGDENVPARDRLRRWLPHIAAQIMGFKDLDEAFFAYPDAEARLDPRKRAVNHYVEEGVLDWARYIRDLTALDVDPVMPFTDILPFLWRPETNDSRRFFYRLCELADEHQDPALRICVVLPFSEFKHVLFGKTAAVARSFTKESGVELEFVSRLHDYEDMSSVFESESELDDATRKKGRAVAEYVCDQIEASWMGNLRFVQKGNPWSSSASRT